MTIRIATVDDLKTIIDMGSQLQNESKDYEPFLTFDWQQAYDHYQKELSSDNARIIVAIDAEGDIAGYQYSYVTTLDYLSKKNRECIFEALYVKPEYRGRGMATELLRSAERWAVRDMKVDRIKAGIYSGNVASEAAHRKDGFQPYYTEYIKLSSTNE